MKNEYQHNFTRTNLTTIIRIILILLLVQFGLLTPFSSCAQKYSWKSITRINDTSNEAVYFELKTLFLGNIASINVEKKVIKQFAIRGGVGYDFGFKPELGTGDGGFISSKSVYIPLSVAYLFGKKQQKLELALGTTLLLGSGLQEILSDFHSSYFYSASIGYRYQYSNGSIFRIGIDPLWKDGKVLPFLSFSFGKSF